MDAGLGRGGIDAGLGRGGIDAGLGRGPPLAAGRWPLPWVMPNGLLPPLRAGGRAPGRPGADGAPGPDGRPPPAARPAAGLPGRGGTAPGPGLGPVRWPPPSAGGSRRVVSRCFAACWAALTLASCSALRAAARASAAATSMSCALAGLATGAADGGGPGTGPLGRIGDGAAGRRGGAGRAEILDSVPLGDGAAEAAGAAAGAWADAANAPRRRRATGASTVLDADLTNSPISLSLARTVLLSTPSSLASSCTRALPATALLTPRSCGQHPQRPHSCT